MIVEGAEFQTAAARLRAAGIEEPEREARLLLAHALGRPADSLIGRNVPVPAGFGALIARRERHEPLALIVGRGEFWSLTLAVSPATLIPRPESETLIASALAAFPERREVHRILDLGTGTGALLLALLSEFPEAFGVGIDQVEAAAALAAANARTLGLGGRAAFFTGDWAGAVGGRFDLVVANPPYVEREAIGELMPEVALYEPRSALDGGPDGFQGYRGIFPELPRLLAASGVGIVEIGAGAASAVLTLARQAGLEVLEVRADLSGIPRALRLSVAVTKKPFGAGG
ncbi:MAG: peptide chain release factor N(5)-glutamine methyltransferase [Acetobacteraceae bacterium]